MTKQQIEVITSVERCRRWSREDNERLVAAIFESDASVSEIARGRRLRVQSGIDPEALGRILNVVER